MKKLYSFCILIFFVLSFSTEMRAQCTPVSNAVSTGIELQCFGGSVFRSGLAWHPEFNLYYSANAGSPGYPLETFSASGELLSTASQGYDFRGLWWNSLTDQLEGNGGEEDPLRRDRHRPDREGRDEQQRP